MKKNKTSMELTTRQLFEQIITQLKEERIYLDIKGEDIYLIQSETFQKHYIKIGDLNLTAKKYNQSCDRD